MTIQCDQLTPKYINIHRTLQIGRNMQICAMSILISIIVKLVLIWCLDRLTVPMNKSAQA